jgi:hypothetical protein
METQEIATRKILEMQACIETDDKKGFMEILTGGYTLNYCKVGDTFLQGKVIAIFKQALEKFVT